MADTSQATKNKATPKPNKNRTATAEPANKAKFPGWRVTCNGNQLVAEWVEARITEGGVFYPITPSTEGGELYQGAFADGKLDVWGNQKIAIETEGEHAAQGGATAFAVAGHRTVNFTSGQGIVYAMEQYYHAPGKCSTMVLEIGARALTKHALNVHCGHDDFYAALDTGWTMLMAKDAQQAADQAIILRRVTELSLNPGMNIQDGMLTTHSERTYFAPEPELLREFLGAPDDIIECPNETQRELFGKTRRRVPEMMDLKNPILLGPVQNQEHHMNGVVSRRNNWNKPILPMLVEAFREFGELTGREYDLVTQYKCEDADTVFVSLGCAAENIEEACDYLRDQRNAKVGSIHINVLRPFPESAVVEALRGKKEVIILERTDEGMAGDNPLGRDIRTALVKAVQAHQFGVGHTTPIEPQEVPRIFRGSYGIGSRDFRPEHILGAYEFSQGQTKRKDGKSAEDGETYFTVGIDHPFEVKSKDTPSLLPQGAIAARFHSIGGWGMITTGKNLGEILGDIGNQLSEADPEYDEHGTLKQKLSIMANPKYGSEKKGAPTNYYLVVAPERVRVNCELDHVDVVLCCDPKAFTHTNPLAGLNKGGCFVWESSESPETAWQRIPKRYREFVKENKIRIFILPGFEIAHDATDRADLQLRMQGNTFLGAFFKVSSFLDTYNVSQEELLALVKHQYEKKFGRFGHAVVESNLKVFAGGLERCTEIHYGDMEAEDRSSMRLDPIPPVGDHQILPTSGCFLPNVDVLPKNADQPERAPVMRMDKFDGEYRNGLGYHQPASALASVGVMAAASGQTQSKYVARRETPKYIAENCTQCMECITACPDTALPNTAQEVSTVLKTAINNYVSDSGDRQKLLEAIPGIETNAREKMNAAIEAKESVPFEEIVRGEVEALNGGISAKAKEQLTEILGIVPMAYTKVPAIFKSVEKKKPGQGGLFSIFVSDLCKGCGECVEQCGDHNALVMVPDTEELNHDITTAQIFSRLLPDTPQKYLGLYQDDAPQDSRPAALRNHLMVRRNYEALVSGDGACAGCGEKSILRAIASVTEAYMRPLYHQKADRLLDKADALEKDGEAKLSALKSSDPAAYDLFKRAVAHVLMGLGGEDEEDTTRRIEGNGPISNADVVSALVSTMRVDAFNHRDLQAVDGRLANGQSVMFMGASTGCNTVYGSTPPSNPHPYPWMNSLFQDGATISWLLSESLLLKHGRRSVVPERLATRLLERDEDVLTADDYFDYTHITDNHMTDQEICELPKVWVVGGDGALGDIGFQNISKVILQNRPNVKAIMLDTQVYSNTGGQNSDSSTMLGGYDMNQFGTASQGKLHEKKSVAEAFTSGHGSPYVAQVSMANSAKLYQSILEGLEYRGTAFFQSFTTCQPEHGVADDMSAHQAKMIRDSRGMPEFVYNPRNGELAHECFQLKGNPSLNRDWWEAAYSDKTKFNFTVAHWATTEARFRKHLKKISEGEAADLVHLDDMLVMITQDDVIYRRVFDPEHRSYVPDFGVYIQQEVNGKMTWLAVSRQMVLFAVERRKAWRMLQSRAGVENKDYAAQKALLAKVDGGEISLEDLRAKTKELYLAELAEIDPKLVKAG